MSITVTSQRSKRLSTNMNIITSSLDISHYHDSCYYRLITIFIFLIFYYFYFLGRLFPDHPEFSVLTGVLERQDGDTRKMSYVLVLLWLLACCLFWGSFLVAVVGYFCCFDCSLRSLEFSHNIIQRQAFFQTGCCFFKKLAFEAETSRK